MDSSLEKEVAVAARTVSPRADEIRRIAADLFERSGYAATTMTDIADAVGVFPGSLYHHFESKEELAVEIVAALNRELNRLPAVATRRRTSGNSSAEERIRQLAREVTTVSMRNAAAVRLLSYEAPTVATDRFRTALQARVPALDRAWKTAVDAVAVTGRGAKADPGLLRFTLHNVSLTASVNYPPGQDPKKIAGQLCDALFNGLVTDCPDDRTLNDSEASRAANNAITRWRSLDRPSTSDNRAEIVAAALREFARRGYEATTIRDIADAAGVRMGTLYRRVESKEAILRDILEFYGSCLDQAVRAVLTIGSSEAESLDALGRVFVHAKRRFRQESEIVKFGWSGREATTSPFHDYYLQTQERLRLLERVLGRGIRSGAIRHIGTPAEIAPHIRTVFWLPFQDFARSSENRSHQFLRETLLRGFVTS
ncbi:TetR family transcriptional regulator [Kribbella sp. VKM Ac-2527]|uniref:TetR family transcriptional regulator n=1 Tax=Kribbella caucasensis TaxID=2512215 RepID=A0A4R6K9N0_9ACTN|nr:TetR/AcrR family transcriptional regulator [Kribbella sp. VKM Ac-2527]TDO46393.1 TetR family transcriptional regulator [Kribbella sp. VKM Ac-2527]